MIRQVVLNLVRFVRQMRRRRRREDEECWPFVFVCLFSALDLQRRRQRWQRQPLFRLPCALLFSLCACSSLLCWPDEICFAIWAHWAHPTSSSSSLRSPQVNCNEIGRQESALDLPKPVVLSASAFPSHLEAHFDHLARVSPPICTKQAEVSIQFAFSLSALSMPLNGNFCSILRVNFRCLFIIIITIVVVVIAIVVVVVFSKPSLSSPFGIMVWAKLNNRDRHQDKDQNLEIFPLESGAFRDIFNISLIIGNIYIPADTRTSPWMCVWWCEPRTRAPDKTWEARRP